MSYLGVCDLDDFANRFVCDSVINQLLNSRSHSWDSEVVIELRGLDKRRCASWWCYGGVLSLQALKSGDVEGIELGLEGIKIGKESDGSRAIIADLHNTVVGWLLGVLVNETA